MLWLVEFGAWAMWRSEHHGVAFAGAMLAQSAMVCGGLWLAWRLFHRTNGEIGVE